MSKKFIYLIKSESSGFCKIGLSKNPDKRIKQLQTGNSDKLYMVSKYETRFFKEIEKRLHLFFLPQKLEGEWFDLDSIQENEFIDTVKNFESKFIDNVNIYNKEQLEDKIKKMRL